MLASPADSNSNVTGGNWFATTHWSVALAGRENNSPTSAEALEKLCRTYWYPLYAYVRRRGYGVPEAEDLTQAFFARFLEKDYLSQVDRSKGKFRSFLLGSLNHFLADEWDRKHRQKRGGSYQFVSLDEEAAEDRYQLEPATESDPEKIYARCWAMALLDRVLDLLEAEYAACGKRESFEVLRGLLLGDKGPVTYAEAAAQLATTEGATRVIVHRMRQSYRELLREEIAQTVSSPPEIEEELQYLCAILRR